MHADFGLYTESRNRRAGDHFSRNSHFLRSQTSAWALRLFRKALKEFKKATRDIEDDIQTAINTEPPRRVQTPTTSVNREQTVQAEPESIPTPVAPKPESKSEETV